MTYTTEQLEKMLAAATPGPWVTQEKECDEFWFADGYLTSGPAILWIADQADAALIAAAPTITAELIAARRKLEWVQGLVEAATALLAQVDGLIPIKHPQQKLERNKLRHAITAIAALDAAQ